MHEQIRLVIVTDNPDEAVADALCCAMTNKPRWARIVSDPMEILHLPNGTKVRGLWYSSRARTSAAEYAWRERRLAGGRFVVPLPHPSGASLWPNRPENQTLIRRALGLLADIRLAHQL
ncbi:MAG: hypothetical protein LRY50_16230 [Geovibrio sp.]|nr:hypothetical protein [Geovibrio sp.]